jgi:hypothetical protein
VLPTRLEPFLEADKRAVPVKAPDFFGVVVVLCDDTEGSVHVDQSFSENRRRLHRRCRGYGEENRRIVHNREDISTLKAALFKGFRKLTKIIRHAMRP